MLRGCWVAEDSNHAPTDNFNETGHSALSTCISVETDMINMTAFIKGAVI